ncbi:AAA family ATPase [Glaciimonas sp. GNP009]
MEKTDFDFSYDYRHDAKKDGFFLFNGLLLGDSLIETINKEQTSKSAANEKSLERTEKAMQAAHEARVNLKLRLKKNTNIEDHNLIRTDTVRMYRFPPLPHRADPHVKIYDKREVLLRYQNVEAIASDREEKQHIKGRLDITRRMGNTRSLITIKSGWRQEFDELERNHPNFSEVIDYMRSSYSVAELSGLVATPGAILLDGPAGCGKTYFAGKLAALMGVKKTHVSLESTQSSFELDGLAEGYKNSKPGLFYQSLMTCDHANQFFLLDEVCKISGDDRHSPASVLFQILEKSTAVNFVDKCENYRNLDCSHFFFVATSNRYENIDVALRSRMRRFQIGMPSDPSIIIMNLFSELKTRKGPNFSDFQLEYAAIELLCQQSPRRIRQLIEDALGSAIYNSRMTIKVKDLKVEKVKPSIGF